MIADYATIMKATAILIAYRESRKAKVIALPVVHRDHEFVEPKKGERKWCALCGKTVHCHTPRVYCSSCGQEFIGLAEGFDMCSSHSHIATPKLEVNR